ncbi:MAG TPA: efflux RND transporter periplasmic adaptor subunit [Thermopetrobacter sp.]|nr:efflux RND transporter periplasmic adaptor subunit [Thermopetrobacter sp.]
MDDKVRTSAAHAAITDDEAALPPPSRAGWLWRGMVALALLIGAVFVWRLMLASAERPRPRPPHERPAPVRAMTVRLTEARPQWTFYGRARAARKVQLRMPAGGTIVRLAKGLKAGREVAADEELVAIDDLNARARLNEALAARKEIAARLAEAKERLVHDRKALENARDQLRLAEHELARVRRLLKRRVAAQKALEAAQLRVKQALSAVQQREAAIAAGQARVQQTEAVLARQDWVVKRARRALRDTVLKAPFAGVVARADLAVGQQVTPNEPLVILIADTPPRIEFTLSEGFYGDLAAAGEKLLGRPLSVHWRTGAAALSFAGRVDEVTPEVAVKSGALTVRAALSDPRRARRLPPGAFVEIRMRGPRSHRVALIPESALQRDDEVFVIADGRLKAVRVEIAGYVGGKVAVRGLPDAARVVVNRLAQPREGRKVRVLP